MSNERIKILKMLENGDITADEASRLLSAIEGNKNTNSNNSNNSNENKQSIDINKFINKITNKAQVLAEKSSKIYSDIEKEVKNKFKNTNIHSNKNMIKEFNFVLLQENNSIELKSFNGEMALKGYNGDKLTLKTSYIPKSENSVIDFNNEENNKYVLKFMEQDFEKVSVEVLVPKKYFNILNISTINSNFAIDSIDCDKIDCETTNSNGIVENCNGGNIKINNINGKLIIRNIKADSLDICNINHYVKLNNVDVKNILIDVLNGKIDVVNDYLNVYENYNWKMEAQNNSISVEINTDNINYDINARTSLGKVNILKNNLLFIEKNDSRVLAKTENYNELYKNVKLDLETTNSTIIIS